LYRSHFKNTKQHNLRLVGVDDGAFPGGRDENQSTLLVAVLLEGSRIVSIKAGRITVDGTDATRVLGSLVRRMRYDAILLSGISFGGFNLVDIKALSRATRRPVIAITGGRPDNAAVLSALRKHFPDWKERWRIVENAGRLYSCKPMPKEPKLYFEVRGASVAVAKRIISSSAAISRLPEPVRVAGILAKGLTPLGG
jgi:endonuclease V-like protein UPF0215 family